MANHSLIPSSSRNATAVDPVIDTFFFRASLTGRQRAHLGEPGIAVAIVALPSPGLDLVLFADMGALNEGASATNAADIVVATVMQRLQRGPSTPPSDLRWLEIDSDGFVDELVLTPSGATHWCPLRAARAQPSDIDPRSIAALLHQPGGRTAWTLIQALQQRAQRVHH